MVSSMSISIDLGHGQQALINEEDDDVAAANWWFNAREGGMACATIGGWQVRLHRYILGVDSRPGTVEFINGDPLDCRRENLRLTRSGHTHYDPYASSLYRDVRGIDKDQRRGLWRARVRVEGHERSGYFNTEQETAQAAAKWRSEVDPRQPQPELPLGDGVPLTRGQAREAAVAARNAEIVQARLDGEKSTAIAQHFGLKASTVRSVLHREKVAT